MASKGRSRRRPQRRKTKLSKADAVVEAYKKDIDRTLIRENLKLTPEERLVRLMRLQQLAAELQKAGRAAR